MLVKTRVSERLLRMLALLWFLVWALLPFVKPPKGIEEVGLVPYILLCVIYLLVWLGVTVLLLLYGEFARRKRLGLEKKGS